MHICVSDLTIIGSDNGLLPCRRQAIMWTNNRTLLIWPLGTNFNKILLQIRKFWSKKIHLKLSSAKWRPFYLALNVFINKQAKVIIEFQIMEGKLLVKQA